MKWKLLSDLVVIFTYDLPRIDTSLGSLSPFQLSHWVSNINLILSNEKRNITGTNELTALLRPVIWRSYSLVLRLHSQTHIPKTISTSPKFISYSQNFHLSKSKSHLYSLYDTNALSLVFAMTPVILCEFAISPAIAFLIIKLDISRM